MAGEAEGGAVIFTLTHRIETTSSQKATAMRDKCAAYLDEDNDVTVINSAMAQDSRQYVVLGANTLTKEPWRKTVEATDEETAKKVAVGSDAPKAQVVVEVRTGV